MIKELKLYDVKSPKIRLGNEWDGGYVLPELIVENSCSLFSYGVGTDISFEVNYSLLTNKKSFLYDYTIDSIHIPTQLEKNIFFKKEGLSYEKKDLMDTFFSHYEQNKIDGQVLLKMDIEEAEFDFFLNSDLKRISELTTGIVVEFHPFNKQKNLDDFFEIVKRLNEFYLHSHFHGNNYAGFLEYEEYGEKFNLPHAIEMAFTNKKLVKDYSLDMGDYPDKKLDRPNRLDLPDYNLNFLKTINKL
jgi:hypothetical protein